MAGRAKEETKKKGKQRLSDPPSSEQGALGPEHEAVPLAKGRLWSQPPCYLVQPL